METIIQQIAQDFMKSITKKVLSEKINDIDALSKDVELDCKDTAKAIIEAVVAEINLNIRKDKIGRKEEGLIIKEKNRSRRIYTKLGTLNLDRDYYYDRKNESYLFPLDQLIGIRKYERIGDTVGAEMTNYAAEFSYAKSTKLATGGEISRQSVRNHILKVNLPEDEIPQEKKEVKTLYVYADEDHAHLQKANRERGKKSQQIPLVSVTEGTKEVSSKRNKTIATKRFVDKNLSSAMLWETIEGYIGANYNMNTLMTIYLYGDGGSWIKNGLERYSQTKHVMDGYHFEKY